MGMLLEATCRSLSTSRLTSRATLAAALFLAMGCGSAATDELVEPAEKGGPVSGSGILIPFATTPPLVQVVSDGADDPQLQQALKISGASGYKVLARGPEDASPARVASSRQVGVVTAKGHYLLDVDAAVLNARFSAMAGRAAPAGSDVPRGWSNAVDNRVRLTTGIPIEQGMVSGVGQCSGALIGRRLARTAAHCVISHNSTGGAAVATARFDAGRSGSSIPATDTTSFYFYGGAYIGSNCGKTAVVGGVFDYWNGYRNNFDACTSADWAILILATDWYSQPGEPGGISWYGYSGLVAGNLGIDLTSYGYPGCDDTLNSNGTNNEQTIIEDPASCRTNPQANYRDNSAKCEVGSFSSGTFKWKTGCDTSGGNSGGPVVERANPTNFLGHCQWQDCTTCTAGTNYPNSYLGHDDFLFNFQNQLRNDYP